MSKTKEISHCITYSCAKLDDYFHVPNWAIVFHVPSRAIHMHVPNWAIKIILPYWAIKTILPNWAIKSILPSWAIKSIMPNWAISGSWSSCISCICISIESCFFIKHGVCVCFYRTF